MVRGHDEFDCVACQSPWFHSDSYPGDARQERMDGLPFVISLCTHSTGKWYHPSSHQGRSESPGAYVLLPLYPGCDQCESLHVNIALNAQYLLVQGP